jgi:hypothetical protein
VRADESAMRGDESTMRRDQSTIMAVVIGDSSARVGRA